MLTVRQSSCSVAVRWSPDIGDVPPVDPVTPNSILVGCSVYCHVPNGLECFAQPWSHVCVFAGYIGLISGRI